MESVQDILNPAAQQDAFTEWMRSPAAGFVGAKKLPDGTYAGVLPLMFTYAICLGVTLDVAYQKRFCYDDGTECLHAFSMLSSFTDEPQGWIARRPKTSES